MDRWYLIPLGIFLLLFGINAVTNLQIVWMAPLTGFAALVAGIIILVKCLR